jgi:hypothetical protein
MLKMNLSRLMFTLFLLLLCTLANASVIGYLDGANAASIGGWACDTSNPSQATSLRVYKGMRLVTTIQTGGYRPDVAAAGLCGGNQYTGFAYAWPVSENDGATVAIHVAGLSASIETALNNSPTAPVSFPGPVVAQPSCTSAAPAVPATSATSGLFRIYAYNVANATSMLFPTWGDAGGQDDLAWYAGVSQGNGTWYADIDLARHKAGNPELGTFSTHVYVAGASGTYTLCASTTWSRTAATPLGPAWPTAPVNLKAVCAANGTSAAISWDALTGTNGYAPRLDYLSNNSAGCLDGWYCTAPDWYQNDYPSTGYVATTVPNQPYRFWVHGKNGASYGEASVINFTCNASPLPPSGNASISAMAGPWPITIRTCDHDAGAICSLTWRNKEFIDDYDHGRQLQSAVAFDGMGESFNPTEAGAEVPYNGVNPSASSSRLQAISASNNVLMTETDMAFWRPVGGRAQSGHILNKEVRIGAFGLPHVIEYKTRFTIPQGETHTSGVFEALTGYMPGEFNQFWTLDMKGGSTNLVPLPKVIAESFEQNLPLIFSTADGGWAMGIYSPDSPQPNHPTAGYGRWDFSIIPGFYLPLVKWNNVFRIDNPAGSYSFRSYVIVGSLDNVKMSMQQLYEIVR